MSGKSNRIIRQVVTKAIAQLDLNSNEARWLYDQLKKNYAKGQIHNASTILAKAMAMAINRRAIEKENRQ